MSERIQLLRRIHKLQDTLQKAKRHITKVLRGDLDQVQLNALRRYLEELERIEANNIKRDPWPQYDVRPRPSSVASDEERREGGRLGGAEGEEQ